MAKRLPPTATAPFGTVYLVTNQKNGKQYVGQTTSRVRERWVAHLSLARRGEGNALHDALRAYGREAFEVDEIERCVSQDDLSEAERYWIRWYGSLAPNGYNLNTGGGHFEVSEETRKKQSRVFSGRKMSGVAKERIRAALTGMKRSPETCAKIGDIHRGKIVSAEARERLRIAHLGQTHGRMSDETKAKISAANKGRVRSAETRAKLAAAKRGKPGNSTKEIRLRKREREAVNAGAKDPDKLSEGSGLRAMVLPRR